MTGWISHYFTNEMNAVCVEGGVGYGLGLFYPLGSEFGKENLEKQPTNFYSISRH